MILALVLLAVAVALGLVGALTGVALLYWFALATLGLAVLAAVLGPGRLRR